MEIWGLCGQCERWFFCDGWFDRDAPQPLCPHCGGEPAAIENRTHLDDERGIRVATAVGADGASADLVVALPTEVWLG